MTGTRSLNRVTGQAAVATVAIVAVATTAAIWIAVTGNAPRSGDGPMIPGDPHGWSTTEAVGETFTDGMEVLRLAGDRSALVEEVRLVGDEGLELVGAKLASPDRGIGWVQYMETFPPDHPELGDDLVDAEGATITPAGEDGSATWELLLGIRATKQGYLVRTGVVVDYRIGDETYTVTLPGHLAVCTSKDLHRGGECPLPPEPTSD